jgi:hypothetical protein
MTPTELDRKINRLLELKAAGCLDFRGERQLWQLEGARGQTDLIRELARDDRENAAGKVAQLRAEAEELENMGAYELKRANESIHRRDEYLGNWKKYLGEAARKRELASRIECDFELEPPAVLATVQAEGVETNKQPQLEMF